MTYFVVRSQLPSKMHQVTMVQIDPSGVPDLATLQDRDLGEGSMDIKTNGSHPWLHFCICNQESRQATRHLRIRARSATGQVEGAARQQPELSAHQILRPAHRTCSQHPNPGGRRIVYPAGSQKMPIEAPRPFMPDNNIVEQDHRLIKRRTRPSLGFKTFASAVSVLAGIEVANMIRKGPLTPHTPHAGSLLPWPNRPSEERAIPRLARKFASETW